MENLRSYNDLQPTYGELANALRQLNFTDKSTGEYFAFYKEEFDAVVLLPLKSRSAKVRKARFAAISSVLAGQGVLEHEYDLGKLIEQSRLVQFEVMA